MAVIAGFEKQPFVELAFRRHPRIKRQLAFDIYYDDGHIHTPCQHNFLAKNRAMSASLKWPRVRYVELVTAALASPTL